MPRDKDRKRIIRNRMKKTGESYTTARAHVLARKTPEQTPPLLPSGYAAFAGMSDEAVSAKTGRTWPEWVRILDADSAAAMPHREIAALLRGKHGVPDWWAQTVTVGYERIKGLRDLGQRRSGVYEAGKSRTFNVPVKELFEAWADDATRRRWLGGVESRVRTATEPKSVRLQWPDGAVVVVGFTAKGKTKSVAAVVHTKLSKRGEMEKAKAYWTGRLDALAEFFAART